MFCTTDAPTVPGIPESPSTPSSPWATLSATKSSQLQPASALTATVSSACGEPKRMSWRASRTTTPSKGTSAARRFEPPPMTLSGDPAASACRTASMTPSRVSGVRKVRIGPPTPMVVRSANVVVLCSVVIPAILAAGLPRRRPARGRRITKKPDRSQAFSQA